MTKKWLMSKVICDAWVATDVMASTASILNLVAIAIDRLVLNYFGPYMFLSKEYFPSNLHVLSRIY